MKTKDLINSLSTNLSPVRRIYPISIVVSMWIVFTFASIFIFLWSRTQNSNQILIPNYSYELILIILTLFFSSFAAIHMSIPGNKTRKAFLYLPITFLFIWLFLILMRSFISISKSIRTDFNYHDCVKDIILMTIPAATVLIYIINRRIPASKHWIGFLIFAASASASVMGLAFICPNDASMHIIIYHFFPVTSLSLVGILVGAFLFREA